MGHVVSMLPRQPDAPRPGATLRGGPRRRSQGRRGCRIAVIGAGFSGVLVALHLLWRCGRNDRVYLVERAPPGWAKGLAYATGNPRHLLNVRIENMSAFADEPDHFVRWLAALPGGRASGRGRAWLRRHLRARQVYGAYVSTSSRT